MSSELPRCIVCGTTYSVALWKYDKKVHVCQMCIIEYDKKQQKQNKPHGK